MQKRPLGNTGYEVSAVVYPGIASMSETQADSDRYVSWAVDRGINYFDVAPSYGDAEEKLGQSLRPYRARVYLACKTLERRRDGAQREIERSLRLLGADHFDLFQLHSMTTPADVDQAFGPGGVMELLRGLKEEGVVRKLGFSAHSETAALRCLELYPFDTVLFPMNWLLDMNEGIGRGIAAQAKRKGAGLLGMKSLIERAWTEEEKKQPSPYPKSWCKPFGPEQEDLRLAAMKYSFSMGSDVLVPPGNFECLAFMAGRVDECLSAPLEAEELRLLEAHFRDAGGQPFFKSSAGGWPA